MITSMDTDDDKDASFSLTESDCPSPALDAAVTPAVVAIVVDLPSTCTLGAETLSSLLSSLSLSKLETPQL